MFSRAPGTPSILLTLGAIDVADSEEESNESWAAPATMGRGPAWTEPEWDRLGHYLADGDSINTVVRKTGWPYHSVDVLCRWWHEKTSMWHGETGILCISSGGA